MKKLTHLVNLGFGIGLAMWTFVMGGFYGLINFGGDFIQWLNAAFLGLAPNAFNTLVNALQSAGLFICFIIWLGGVVALFLLRAAGKSFTVIKEHRATNSSSVGGPVVDGTAREL